MFDFPSLPDANTDLLFRSLATAVHASSEYSVNSAPDRSGPSVPFFTTPNPTGSPVFFASIVKVTVPPSFGSVYSQV